MKKLFGVLFLVALSMLVGVLQAQNNCQFARGTGQNFACYSDPGCGGFGVWCTHEFCRYVEGCLHTYPATVDCAWGGCVNPFYVNCSCL